MSGIGEIPETGPAPTAAGLSGPIGAVCFDWGGTLVADDGPDGVPMCRWPSLTMTPGARECLAALHDRLPLCVATNAAQSSRAMIETALDRVDLLRFVGEIFCFTEIGHRKDRPGFWQEVRRRLGIPLDRIVMVGDSLEHDIAAPRRFGVQTVWFNPGGRRLGKASPSMVVTDLGEIVEPIERLV